jgi:simple sugar transport system ATP-binding protein
LPVGAQQRLEIVKALARDATTLLLDEPTAVLAPAEAAELLKWLRGFADGGGSVLLITHRLRDALAVADDVTVLRRGSVVLSAPVASIDERSLATALLGEEVPAEVTDVTVESFASVGMLNPASARIARLSDVSVQDERGVSVVRSVTIDVHAGEIVGIAAVEGSGQRALLRVLAARTRATSGAVELPSKIGFVPEDRQRDGLVMDFSLAENLALRDAGARTGRIRWGALRRSANDTLRTFDVRARDASEPARALSGGNQQKLVLARELSDNPILVVAENPTRGLDIRAAQDVHSRLRHAAARGAGVILHSSDLDEVLTLAHRVVVMHAGQLNSVPRDRDSVGRAMLGVA